MIGAEYTQEARLLLGQESRAKRLLDRPRRLILPRKRVVWNPVKLPGEDDYARFRRAEFRAMTIRNYWRKLEEMGWFDGSFVGPYRDSVPFNSIDHSISFS